MPTLREFQITTMAAFKIMAKPIVTIAATKVGRPSRRRISAKYMTTPKSALAVAATTIAVNKEREVSVVPVRNPAE